MSKDRSDLSLRMQIVIRTFGRTAISLKADARRRYQHWDALQLVFRTPEVLAGFTATCGDIFTLRFVDTDRIGRLFETLGSTDTNGSSRAEAICDKHLGMGGCDASNAYVGWLECDSVVGGARVCSQRVVC
ncbi:MAG: hypothetical protein NT013_30870 [Planctomycetia bacterium]|nr:hypothetical protein [Planctomycetia bacterium]